MDTNTGGSPRIPEPVPIARKLAYSEEVVGHWILTGCGPTDILYHTIPLLNLIFKLAIMAGIIRADITYTSNNLQFVLFQFHL